MRETRIVRIEIIGGKDLCCWYVGKRYYRDIIDKIINNENKTGYSFSVYSKDKLIIDIINCPVIVEYDEKEKESE